MIGVQIANQRLQQRRFTHAIGAGTASFADFEQQIDILSSGPLSKPFVKRFPLPERYGTVLSCSNG